MSELASTVDPAGQSPAKVLGFWTCWSLTVGVMIGSGIFTLPAVLAPYGLMSFGGWALSVTGSILIALTIARLAGRTSRTGGPYVFAYNAFGGLVGFLTAWGFWASYWTAIPALAITFVGYLPVIFPALATNPFGQAAAALALIWTLTFLAIRGTRTAGLAQLAMTVLKLIPLAAVVGLALAIGDAANLPAVNPSGGSPLSVLAATAVLTMWAFGGLEAGCLPAGDVKDPERTIPRALMFGVLTVAAIYLATAAAVMLLVPAETLARSTSPIADAARGLGPFGPLLVAAGALVATAGSLNGTIFIAGQLPMAVAVDQLAPAWLARVNGGGSPHISLIVSSVLGSLLLIANYTRGLTAAFTFLLLMSTLANLVPYFASAAAELRHSWRSARGWAAVALSAGLFCILATLGAGIEAILWSAVLMAAGIPFYFLGRAKFSPAPARET